MACDERYQRCRQTDTRIRRQAGIEKLRQSLPILHRGQLGDVANHRRTYAKIEDSVIAGDGKDQDPNTKSGVSEPMQNERRQKKPNDDIDSEAEPAGTDVF